MSIRIVPASLRVTADRTAVYRAPADCTSATVVTGYAEVHGNVVGARLWIVVSGREYWYISGKTIDKEHSPFVLPPVTLKPGEALEAWSEGPMLIDLSLTIGEQR